MIRAIISDFSRTLLFPKDKTYEGSLNQLYKDVKQKEGFKFFEYFEWNQSLEEFYEKLLLEKKIDIYIFTTEKIQEDPEVYPFTQRIFSDVFTVEDTNNLTKDNAEAYRLLALRLELKPEEVLFIDDSEINITAARSAGLNVIQYRNISRLTNDFNKINS